MKAEDKNLNINDSLAAMQSITLEEMDSVKLMNRTDTKYYFHVDQLPRILEKVKPYYKILEVEGERGSDYETLYYDTEDFMLYHAHQSERKNRYKIRARKYLSNQQIYFEIKFKNNKDRTVKELKKVYIVPEIIAADERLKKFMQKTCGSKLNPELLKPALWVDYTRITLVGIHSPERVTIDINLKYRWDGKVINKEHICISEIKQDKITDSYYKQVLREFKITKDSFSKYSTGIALMYPHIKKNNFLSNLRKIQKLEQEVYA